MSESTEGANRLDQSDRSEAFQKARAGWMAELAKAPGARLTALKAALWADPAFDPPAWRWLRPPEIGLVMARGRAGGEGRPFNLGEVSATRCALRLQSGAEGVAYILGRDVAKAEAAALLDAALQTDAAPLVERLVLAPLRAERARREAEAAEAAARTKVEFFTLTRGEDA